MIGAVVDIVISLLSSHLYDVTTKTIEKKQSEKFILEIRDWTCKYISTNDGSVLTTEDFGSFLKNYRLIENTVNQVSNGRGNISKETFINDQINLFYKAYPENNRAETGNVLRSFIECLYDKIDKFFLENLSQKEKYAISRVYDASCRVVDIVQKNSEIIQAGIEDVKSIISNSTIIRDPEILWSIYKTLSTNLLEGKIDDVLQIYPLLSGKSVDLEYSVSFLIKLLSNSDKFNIVFDQIEKVDNELIYSDICQIAVYVNLWRGNKEELKKISDRDHGLYQIVQTILNDNYEKFYITEKSVKDGVTYFTYSVQKHYPEKQWLVNRICILSVLQQPVVNISEIATQIVVDSRNILDNIVILERRILETYNKYQLEEELATELYNKACELVRVSDGLAMDLQCKIFEMLLRISLLVSLEESEKCISLVPEVLYGNKDIDLLIAQVKLGRGTVESDEVLNLCMKYGEYWLLNNYLYQYIDEKPIEMKKLIENYRFIIEIDPSIFLLYVQLVKELDGQDKAVELLYEYQEKHGCYLEFWINRLALTSENNIISFMIENYNKEKLIQLSNEGLLIFIRILIKYEKYDEVIKIIKKQEAFRNTPLEYSKFKAIALCHTGHELESLAVFKGIFFSGNHNEEIIYYILALSFRNGRTVPEEVLLCAEKSKSLQNLVLAAEIYITNNKIEVADTINLKAMLQTKECNSNVFNQRIRIETMEEHLELIQINLVSENTIVYLKSNDLTTRKVYAIHSRRVLPEEPYFWEGVINIYKETAITLGLFRKRQSEEVILDNVPFIIEKIEPLGYYLFGLSMDKVIETGGAREISVPEMKDGKIDIDVLVQEIKTVIGNDKKQCVWLDRYKDLAQFPISFYYSKHFVRTSYFQLVSTICTDKSILYREEAAEFDLCDENYIISYAALVVLYKLGWNCSREIPKYAIPKVLKKIISDEVEEIIRQNNRENVAFMGIEDDRLYLIENTEVDKQQYMQEAVELKAYCEKFFVIDNDQDLHVENEYKFDIKEVLGITDYDSIIIARNKRKILVTAEMIVSAIAKVPDIDVKFVCIADFIARESRTAEELLAIVRRMIEFKFTVPFTTNTIYRIMEFFNNSEEEEKRKILSQWLEMLNLPIGDKVYSELMHSHIRECISKLKTSEDWLTPIVGCLISIWFKYSGHKIEVGLDEEGKLIANIVKNEK